MQLSSCKTISYRLLNLNYSMDSRFLNSEEQAILFPLKTSSHHQLARNLFYPVVFCLPTNFPFAEPPGTWLNAGMAAAGNATCTNWPREKAGGTSGRNLSPAAQNNVFWVICTAHNAQRLCAPCNCLFKVYFELLCADLTAQSTLSMPANSFALVLIISGESRQGKIPALGLRDSCAGAWGSCSSQGSRP